MPAWKRVIVSGSDATLTSVTATAGFTGSLLGTASFAVSASRAVTSSFVTGSILTSANPARFATQFQVLPSSSAALNVDLTQNKFYPILVPVRNDGNNGSALAYYNSGSFSYDFGTNTLTVTSSRAVTSSFVTGSIFTSANPALTASFAVSASRAVTSSFAQTASFVNPLNQSVTITGSLRQGQAGNIASGVASHAEGGGTTATGNYSHAEGHNTITYGFYSHAEGFGTTATGNYSHAEGTSTQAIGNSSHAEGWGSITNGQYSHAEGDSNTANGDYSHAEGGGTTATGNYSHAEGSNTQAVGNYSHAEGSGSLANGDYSHAEGNGTIVGSVQGYRASSISSGVITLDSTYGDVSAEYANGNVLLFDDLLYDNAYGVTTFIVDSVSYNFVTTEITLTDLSVTTTTAIVGNITYGISNWTGGYPIGGQYSHAEGASTQAVGYASHAEGENTQAIGNYSHAEGSNTQAVGNYSHAEGFGTIASGSYQHVQGQYNIPSLADSAFIIGNGIDDNNRSNLVFASGSQVQITGSLIVSGSGTFTGTQILSGSLIFAPPTSPAFNGEIVRFGSGTLTIGQLYFLSSSGTWSLANANSTGSSTGMLGIATGTSPTTAGLLVRGYAASSSYTTATGSIVYAATSSGLMTTTSPSLSNHVVRVVGYVTTIPNTIYFAPDPTFVTLA